MDDQKPRAFETHFPNNHGLNNQKHLSHQDVYSNIHVINPTLATYRKSEESLGFKVMPQIVQSLIKTNFDERKLEKKGGAKNLNRPIGPPKRFVNLGKHRSTKQKVFTGSIGNRGAKRCKE